MNYRDELVKRAGAGLPAFDVPTDHDWQTCESELKCILPSSLKNIVTSLGYGYFGCGMRLINPVSKDEMCASESLLLEYKRSMSILLERLPVKLYPESLGLIRIGRIDARRFLLTDKTGTELYFCDFDFEKLVKVRMSLAKLIVCLHMDSINADWARYSHGLIWDESNRPFFTPQASRPITESPIGSGSLDAEVRESFGL